MSVRNLGVQYVGVAKTDNDFEKKIQFKLKIKFYNDANVKWK